MERERRLSLAFFVAMALFVSATLGMTAYTLWLLRSDAIKSGLDISALLARSFEDHLTQSLHATELAGVNAVSSENGGINLGQMKKDFVSILRNSPYLRSMSLLDENYHIIASSNPGNLGMEVSTRNYFPVATGVQSFLRIGPPRAGRDFADGQASSAHLPADTSASFVPVTQGVTIGPRNMTLLVALNPDYFLHHMSRQFDTKAGSVEVLRLDGLQLMATDPERSVGTPKSESGTKPVFDELEFGEFEQILKNNHPVLTAFRVSSLYPFVVVTHVQRDYALIQWRTETKTILGIVVPTLVLVSLLAVAFYRRQLLLKAKTAEAYRLQQVNAARVFTNSREGIMIVASDGRIVDVNDAFTRITGYSRAEALGQNPRILSSGRQTKEFYADLWRDLIDHGFWSGEIWNRHKDGTHFAEMLTISAVSDSQGIAQQFVAQFSDVTERKAIEDKVRLMAFHDPLTMLPNRRMLTDRLSQAMAASKRSGLCGALMFLDLDNFKPLNDTHGHEVGDLLLIEVATRLKGCLREVDTVARFGGDEFVVMLGELAVDKAESTEQARGVAEKIRVSLAVPYFLTQTQPGKQDIAVEHYCSTSIGVVVFVNHEVGQTDLMKWADAAMYQAKDAGRNAIRFYGVSDD
jgi:diguanylate cyclase (GGDEF)-like protein/PAS domain S-box-containing protein